jgi:signal transduction histidine kinase
VLTVLLIYENSKSNVAYSKVGETQEVRRSIEELYSSIKEVESAQRGYIITGDSLYLGNYTSIQSFDDQFQALDSLTIPDPVQHENVAMLKDLVHRRVTRLSNMLNELKRPGYRRSARFNTDLLGDFNIMDSVSLLVDEMQKRELRVLENRQGSATRQSALPMVFGISISLISILIFILAFYFTNTELKISNRLNNELESKNLQLEKYTRELSSFTRITSHDMQEPLRKIELFISLIEDREKGNLSENAVKYFEKIKDSVGRMRRLFLSILNFYLTDQIRHKVETVDLNEVLHDTMASLKVYIRDTNAAIESKHLPEVQGVRSQLVQLFENLISNSLKFKKNNIIPEVKISCSRCTGDETGLRDLRKDLTYHRIDFSDNGIGFDQKYVEKIFDIFQRLHVDNENYAVGIGLSICRKIAQNHNGAITAVSAVDKGSVFSFFIPVSQDTGVNL